METKVLQCIQCDAEFEFSVQDQLIYDDKGYDEPRRCPLCRKNKSRTIQNTDTVNKKNRKKNYRTKYADDQQ